MHKSAPLMIALLLMMPAVAADWSGYHGGNEHQGRSLGVGPTSDQLKWTFDGGALAYGSPVIHPDTQHILFGNIDGELYAVDGKGKQVWKATVPGEIHGSPLVSSDGSVYVQGAKLVKFSATGQKLWTVDTHNADATKGNKVLVAGSPIELGAQIAVTSVDGKLYVVSKAGNVQCKFTAEGAIWGTPVVTSDDLLVFGTLKTDSSGDDVQPRIHAVDRTCKEAWNMDLTATSVSTYLVDDAGSLFISGRDRLVQKVDPSTGKPLKQFDTEGAITGPMALSPDGKTLYVGNIAGELYALKTSDLSMVWSEPIDIAGAASATQTQYGGSSAIGIATGPVVDAAGNVFFSSWFANLPEIPPTDSYESTMYGYDSSGKRLWSHTVDKAVAPMMADHGVLYAAGMDGKLYAFGGNALPVARFDAGASSLSVSLDASASLDADGSIKAYSWDFGDGKTGKGELIEHNYAEVGTYTIELTAKDDAGASSKARLQVAVTAPSPGTTAPPTTASTATSEPVAADPAPDSADEQNGIPAPGVLSMLVLMAALFMTRRR